jgi:triacylglycerol lipase
MKKLFALALALLLVGGISAPALAAPAAAAAAAAACATQYPVVLVHGAGFGDTTLGIGYWGRIPAALEAQGAWVFYGETDGWGSVESNAAQLKARVEAILAETGAKKVNIIAHSKGGLDARCMISSLGMEKQVASLTTFSTPHRGVAPLDTILEPVPDFLLRALGFAANGVRYVMGDKQPDFYTGVIELTAAGAAQFNKQNPNKKGVYYQSYAAAMRIPMSDILLCWPNLFIKKTEGENDGLVPVSSAKWGEFKGVLRGTGKRGISHADLADLRRSDIPIAAGTGETNIRALYIAVVADLKARGY